MSPAVDTLPSALLDNVVRFGRALRQAGVPLGVSQTLDACRALPWVDLGRRDQVFFTLRALLIQRREDLPIFEALFARWFTARPLRPDETPRVPAAPRQEASSRPLTIVDILAQRGRAGDPGLEVPSRAGTASEEESLRHKRFAAMTTEELAAVRKIIRSMRFSLGERTTRRRIAAPHGDEIDRRAALRDAARLGAVPARLPRRARRIKPRPLVLLADVSGSMETISRLVLQLFYAMVHGGNQAGGRGNAKGFGSVECLVFGTRLTRLTQALGIRNVDRAIAEASRAVDDWSGGTRIGESLATFNRRWARRVLRRGAVVLVISDGWECGDPERLRDEMAWLQRRCHRSIWLNPRLGDRGYQPRVAGMRAALPYIDDFLPVHDLVCLEQLATHLRRLPSRRRSARGAHRPPPTAFRDVPAVG